MAPVIAAAALAPKGPILLRQDGLEDEADDDDDPDGPDSGQ
jgi:hypothetical protein